MIPASEYLDYAKRFKRLFGLQINHYCDQLTTTPSAFGFDYEKFAEYIESKFPYAKSDGVSLRDVICKEYGTNAAKLIEQML